MQIHIPKNLLFHIKVLELLLFSHQVNLYIVKNNSLILPVFNLFLIKGARTIMIMWIPFFQKRLARVKELLQFHTPDFLERGFLPYWWMMQVMKSRSVLRNHSWSPQLQTWDMLHSWTLDSWFSEHTLGEYTWNW